MKVTDFGMFYELFTNMLELLWSLQLLSQKGPIVTIYTTVRRNTAKAGILIYLAYSKRSVIN